MYKAIFFHWLKVTKGWPRVHSFCPTIVDLENSIAFILTIATPRALSNRWCLSVCLFVTLLTCEQRNQKIYCWIFFKFSHIIYICLSKSRLNFGDANVTVAYFKATLRFMGPLPCLSLQPSFKHLNVYWQVLRMVFLICVRCLWLLNKDFCN